MYETETMAPYWSLLTFLMSFGLILMLLLVVVLVLTVIGKWKVLDKLGKRPWAALIPYFSDYEMCGGVGAPQWLTIAYPVVGLVNFALTMLTDGGTLASLCGLAAFVLCCMMCHFTSQRFGKNPGWTVGLALLGFVFWPILGLGSSEPLPETPAIEGHTDTPQA